MTNEICLWQKLDCGRSNICKVQTPTRASFLFLKLLFLFPDNRRLESVKKRLDKDSLDKHSALRIDNYCHGLNNYSSGLGYHKFAVEMDPK